jgi:hypothetical protein
MSTYSPSLRIELITTGDQAGTWGTTTNTNLGTLVESAIVGYIAVSITSANQALTALDGAPDQSRNQTIALTTTTTAPFNVYAPPAEKTYIIYNASAYAATIYNSTVLGNTTAAGTGIIVPAGRTVTIWSDGTNFRAQNDHLPTVTTAATATIGTNTTQLATTAFVQAALAALHPVGSVYINATNGTNPASLLGFGTWVSFGAGRVPVGFNAGDSRFDTPEETGGSYDATLPSHTHSWSGSSSGSVGSTDLSHSHTYSASFSGNTGNQSNGHEHTFSGNTFSAGAHQHAGDWPNDCTSARYQFGTSGAAPSGVFCDTLGTVGYSALTNSVGTHDHFYGGTTSNINQNHTHSFSGSVSGTTSGASTSMNHNHSVSVSTSGSNSTEGSSASSANIQPYITVYMWKRTA